MRSSPEGARFAASWQIGASTQTSIVKPSSATAHLEKRLSFVSIVHARLCHQCWQAQVAATSGIIAIREDRLLKQEEVRVLWKLAALSELQGAHQGPQEKVRAAAHDGGVVDCRQTWRHHLATSKRVMVTPAVCPRLFEILTTFTFRALSIAKKNTDKESSLSICDQQCIMCCQEHNQSWNGVVWWKKNEMLRLWRLKEKKDHGFNEFEKLALQPWHLQSSSAGWWKTLHPSPVCAETILSSTSLCACFLFVLTVFRDASDVLLSEKSALPVLVRAWLQKRDAKTVHHHLSTQTLRRKSTHETSQPQQLLQKWYLLTFRRTNKHKQTKRDHNEMKESPLSKEGTKRSKTVPSLQAKSQDNASKLPNLKNCLGKQKRIKGTDINLHLNLSCVSSKNEANPLSLSDCQKPALLSSHHPCPWKATRIHCPLRTARAHQELEHCPIP